MPAPTPPPDDAPRGGIKLGVLDFGIITQGKTARQVLDETRRLAPLVESLGYTRYWVVEHHESHYAWASPEVMLPFIAQHTKTIRVGSAAVLLCLYSPLKVAEVFRLLEQLHPGRIDLGVCAGVPLDEVALHALLNGPARATPQQVSGRYAEQVEQLLAYLHGRFPEGQRFAEGATPAGPDAPPVWLMGTGFGNAHLAAAHGASLSYSLFHRASTHDPELVRRYRDAFRPGAHLREPRLNLAVAGICAETEEAARRQQALVEHWLKGDIKINFVGTPEQCSDELEELRHRYAADEFIFHSLWHSTPERAASYEMLADVLKL